LSTEWSVSEVVTTDQWDDQQCHCGSVLYEISQQMTCWLMRLRGIAHRLRLLLSMASYITS